MSVKASRYAIDWARANKTLGQGARAVLLALAASADRLAHEGYTGEWLAEVAGMNDANMRRNVARLAELGAFAVEHRRGKASIIRFPLSATVAAAPEGRHDDNGVWHPGFCACVDCLDDVVEA